MKKLSLMCAITITCMFTLSACSSNATTATQNEISESQLSESSVTKAMDNVKYESEQNTLIGANEIRAAIEAYGEDRYFAIFPAYNEMYNQFIKNPNAQTKTELMSFLRENELFAQIVKPTPDSLFQSALAKGVSIMGYDGAECDYTKIEAYFDQKISEKESGTGLFVVHEAR